MLSTIRCPKNLLYLTDRLPKPSYNSKNLIDESSESDSEENVSMSKLPNLSRNQVKNFIYKDSYKGGSTDLYVNYINFSSSCILKEHLTKIIDPKIPTITASNVRFLITNHSILALKKHLLSYKKISPQVNKSRQISIVCLAINKSLSLNIFSENLCIHFESNEKNIC